MTSQLNASEAITGFAAWITSRADPLTVGSQEDCAPIVGLVDQFIKANNLPDIQEGWQHNLTHPVYYGPESTGKSPTAEAFEVLKKALQDDPEYAHGWHCNIAMMSYDAIRAAGDGDHEDAHAIGNDAATRFMKLCFDVKTSQ